MLRSVLSAVGKRVSTLGLGFLRNGFSRMKPFRRLQIMVQTRPFGKVFYAFGTHTNAYAWQPRLTPLVVLTPT